MTTSDISIAVLCGSPRHPSRSAEAGAALAEAIGDAWSSLAERAYRADLVLLADFEEAGARERGPIARSLMQRVANCDLLVVCSPTYKATYSGLLKSFVDGFDSGILARKVAVPLMLYGDPRHAMAADVHLRPLLIELGASCPTTAVALQDGDDLAMRAALDAWVATNAPLIIAALAPP